MSLELMGWALVFALAGIVITLPGFLLAQVLHARRGPWRQLADAYPFPGRFDGRRWRLRAILMRPRVSYHGLVTVGANRQGLYLASMLPAAGHRPMLIPWSHLTIEPAEGRLRLVTRAVPAARIELGRPLLLGVIEEAAEAWPAGAALVEERVYE